MSRTAIVTGASRGIGAAVAKRLAAGGYVVCVNYRQNKNAAESVVRAITVAGGKAAAIAADMASEADIVRLFDQAEKTLGPIAALVNNAAISPSRQALAETSADTIRDVLVVNTTGVLLCCREALRRMMPGGAIVNLSSEAARGGGNRIAAYAASKAAVVALTTGLAREAAAQGVRVNAVSPGVIDTDMHAPMNEEQKTALLASIPMGRMGHADEVAAAVAWLLSEEASYVSGAVLPVAGGR